MIADGKIAFFEAAGRRELLRRSQFSAGGMNWVAPPRVPPAIVREVAGPIGLHPGLYYITHEGFKGSPAAAPRPSSNPLWVTY